MTASLTIVQPDPAIRPALEATAIRMADEGIPVRAIARTTRLPSDDVYEVLNNAVMRGVIVEIPKDDWPTGSSRISRNPCLGTALEEEEELKLACSRCFKATPLEASVLAILLKRTVVTKAQLHQVIELGRRREREETDPKIVDVIICHLRKKLKKFDINITTVWGVGYLIPPTDRQDALNTLFSLAQNAASTLAASVENVEEKQVNG